MWLKTDHYNPGAELLKRYVDNIYRHLEHSEMLRGSRTRGGNDYKNAGFFNKCRDPVFKHACLDQLSPDGNIQFKDPIPWRIGSRLIIQKSFRYIYKTLLKYLGKHVVNLTGQTDRCQERFTRAIYSVSWIPFAMRWQPWIDPARMVVKYTMWITKKYSLKWKWIFLKKATLMNSFLQWGRGGGAAERIQGKFYFVALST